MRLLDLDPVFLRCEITDTQKQHHIIVDTIDQCQGIQFLCPKCFRTNYGPVGTHRVICWSAARNTPPDASPSPGRWLIAGRDFSNLTLECELGKTRSIQVLGGCYWHGYITHGVVSDA